MSEALLTPLDLAFLLSGGVTIAMQLLFFAFAAALKIDKVTDLAGCTNFVVLAAGTLFLSFDLIDNRRIVLTSLVCASRLELAAFLFYRVLKRGKDSRFDAVRERCLVFLVLYKPHADCFTIARAEPRHRHRESSTIRPSKEPQRRGLVQRRHDL